VEQASAAVVDDAMRAFAEATDEALLKGDMAAAEKSMKGAIDYQRGKGEFVTMVNLELDLMELYGAKGDTKKRNALKRQVAKDRNDLFPAEAKEKLRQDVPARIAAATTGEPGRAVDQVHTVVLLCPI
jgi:hypothetical protein